LVPLPATAVIVPAGDTRRTRLLPFCDQEAGRDLLHVRGRGRDRVHCGDGRDTILADKRDSVRGGEHIVRRSPGGGSIFSFRVARIAVCRGGGDLRVACGLGLPGRMSARSVSGRVLGTVVAFAASLALAGPAAGAPGDLDPTYGGDGLTAVSLGTATVQVFPIGAVLQRDGKLVLVGTAVFPTGGEFMIVRLTSNGELDPSFGDDGIAVIPVDPAGGAAFDAVSTPDGGLVVVGEAGVTPRMAAIRLDRFGRRDDSFGDGGVFLSETEAEALGVARAADGSLLLAGSAFDAAGNGSLAMQKLTADGEPDTTFGPPGGDGLVRVTFPGGNSGGQGVAVVPDGRVLVSGSTITASGDHALALARFTPAGAPDPTFGGGSGTVTTGVGAGVNGNAADVALAADGKIVAAGSSGPGQFAVGRWLLDGTPDPAFGSGGTVITPILTESAARAVFALPDGRVIAAGRALESGSFLFAVARYRPDGSLDPGFGTGGTVVTRFGSASASGVGAGITSDGKLVLGGSYSTNPAQPLAGGIAAARYFLIDPPSNQTPPTVSGSGAAGQPLTRAPGTWSGADAFDFLWLRNGAPIVGAITSTYVPLTSDAGTALSCSVTARNGGGSRTATSAGVVVFVPSSAPSSAPPSPPPRRAARAQTIPVSAFVKVTRAGVARVRVICRARGVARCRGRLTLISGDRGLGARRYAIPAGASRMVPVRLRRPARTRLAEVKVMTVKARTRTRQPTGGTRTIERPLVLRLPRR
jgi:uncharacterized delta-60 repeat protein